MTLGPGSSVLQEALAVALIASRAAPVLCLLSSQHRRRKEQRSLEEILEFNFAASSRFIIQDRRETLYLSDQKKKIHLKIQ